MQRINVVIVGAGMYVTGRGTDSLGTIMPALYEWNKKQSLGDIYLASTGQKSINQAKKKIKALEKVMGLKLPITYYPTKTKNNVSAYKDAINEIPKPAACIVSVPDDLHKRVAEYAIRNGLHTLVVKPLAPTVKEVYQLIRAQDRAQVYGAVEFHKRLDWANLKLRDAISNGKIGEPLYFIVEYSQRKSIPTKMFKKWAEKTNIFQYLGVHYVDIIKFVTGARPIRVMATGQKTLLLSQRINAYDATQAVIEWKMPSGNKFSSYILTNWIDPEHTSAMSDQKIKVIGTKGRFESDQKNRGIKVVTDKNGQEEPNPYFCTPYGKNGNVSYKGYGIDSIHQFLSDVMDVEDQKVTIKALEGKRPTFRDSIITTKVLEGVGKSLKNNGKWISLEDLK